MHSISWHRPGRAGGSGATFTAGFGASVDPLDSNVEAVSFRRARRSIDRALALHGRLVGDGHPARADLLAARASLAQASDPQPWTYRVRGGQLDLTFWILPATEARRLGARPKRSG